MRSRISLLFLLVIVITALATTPVQAQDTSPWSQVFDGSGNLRSDVVDLGVTTDTPSWMSADLPFGQSLQLDANYHRYQTADGNVVIVPSASTLFFMAMNPNESGLAGSAGMMSNGYGSIINFLGMVTGDNLDWNRLQRERPQYKDPSQFWNAVLSGQENAWTWFSGLGFITKLLSMSIDDAAMRNAYLMYLNGVANCSKIPGGCSGIVQNQDPQPKECPNPQVTIGQPTLSIQKIAPANALVIGQDLETRRGADIQALVTIPPVIFIWYEPIYENHDICRAPRDGETPNCQTGSDSPGNEGVHDSVRVFKECKRHEEHLRDQVVSMQATATLDGASKAWITGDLSQNHYGAFVHQDAFSLVPGLTTWTGGCDGNGTCKATANALRVPFADPGKFNLKLYVATSGTNFGGLPITQPRSLGADGTFQVYVTLPALIP